MGKTSQGYVVNFRMEIEKDCVRKVLNEIEWCQEFVWVSKTVKAQRATFKGIPGKRIDLVIDPWTHKNVDVSQASSDPPVSIVVEVGEKTGKFDGETRPRITIRRWSKSQVIQPFGQILTKRTAYEFEINAIRQNMSPWSFESPTLRSMQVYDNPVKNIILWHCNRYYKHLLVNNGEDVHALAESFSPSGETLAEVNREASRDLYRLSRDLGWRKLTQRERKGLGIESGQWVNSTTYDIAQSSKFSGIGDRSYQDLHGTSECSINWASRKG